MGVPQPTATVRWNHMAAQNVSKKRKFVADGVFYAELHELLVRELAEDGYSGVEVRQTPARHEIIIRATRTQNVLERRAAAFASSLPSCRSVSTSLLDPLSCTLRRCSTVVCALSPRPSPSATSFLEASPPAGLAMALSASLWRAVPSVSRSCCLARSGVSVPRA